MTDQEIFTRLQAFEEEVEVDELLSGLGYELTNEAVWKPLGGYENNFSTVGNQHSEATGAFVEKVINGIDALLMAECFKRGIDPEGADAPRTMAEAIERFYGIKDGRLDSFDPKQLTALAEREQMHVVATGGKISPCYLIIDGGEGQTPDRFPDTFLSLNRSNKMRIPFVQGKFNSGGTAVLQFCGDMNMQLIVSRRHPNAPVLEGDMSRDLWGFTIVRRRRPQHGEKISTYVYLSPNGVVPRFTGDTIQVLPQRRNSIRPEPYSSGLRFGTCIKLYNYRWRARSIATTETRYELERYLHAPCLPIRLTETRDYKANYYSTTISGVWVSIRSGSEGDAESVSVEPGFPAYAELDLLHVGQLPYRIVVFKEEVNPRHFPHGVFFTMNGQVHGELPADFITRALKFDYLRDHLLVSIDCTEMADAVREDFFLASRDRIRKNETYEVLLEKLKDALKDHPGLRELNALRRKKDIERAITDESETAKVFNELLRTDPALSALFSLGDRLVTTVGPIMPVPFAPRKFPTYFRLVKTPPGGLIKNCPINRTCRIDFETDAENDYFTRADSPGVLLLSPANLIEHSALWNGRFTTQFTVPWNAAPGEMVPVEVKVEDVESVRRGGPFVNTFTLIVGEETESRPGGRSRSSSRTPQSVPQNGKNYSQRLALPPIRDVHWPEQPYTALRIKHDDKGVYEFFLNLDNTFLLTELTRSRDDDRSLIVYWFKYGLALCALGVLQSERQRMETRKDLNDGASEQDQSNEVDPERVGQTCDGLARVIVPIIRALYRGPQLVSTATA